MAWRGGGATLQGAVREITHPTRGEFWAGTGGALLPCSQQLSRAYLHHVVRAQEIIASMLLTWHNLHYYHDLMARLRGAIAKGRLATSIRFRYRIAYK